MLRIRRATTWKLSLVNFRMTAFAVALAAMPATLFAQAVQVDPALPRHAPVSGISGTLKRR